MMEDKKITPAEAAEAGVPERKAIRLRLFLVLLLLGWTAAVGVSLWYNTSRLHEHALDSARLQARTVVEKDVVYRQWNSMHGGVFVPMIPGKFDPNPYLPEKGREIVGQDGKIYTKINPAYMTRLVHEIGALRSGVIGHITSNKPIRKGNEPDAWESAALTLLENRTTEEVSDFMHIDGTEVMRLIRGLETDQSCLPCHSQQGYKVGDIRGGISVTVPMAPFLASARETQRILFGTHLSLWVVGLLGISFGMRKVSNGIRERDQAEQSLRELTGELERRVNERTADLRAREQEMRAFVDNTNAGVFLKGLDGVFRIANAQFASILDHTQDMVIGRKIEDILDVETVTPLLSQERAVIESATGRELKNAFTGKDGTRYSCFIFPVLEEESVVGIGGLLVDMTERDNTERVLRQARDAAEKASRAKSDFLANMSHEIRTPLNGVIGMADLLLRTRLTADQASMAAAIKTSGDSLLLVLNDVLDISKIEAGKLALEHISFQLRDVLFDSTKGLTPIAYKKNIELILHVSPAVPEHVVGDPVRIRQIILNLVNNALKFTEQGEVVITVLLVSKSAGKARLRFSVTDTGIGIPLEKQANIFQAFEQVDTSTTRKYGGTGLGLAICSRLLFIMDSKLELKSHEGFGSSFWFEIELPIDKGDMPAQKPLVCTEALQGLRALIVDDNETNLRILMETLESWGMEVSQARSADEGFALANVAGNSKRPFRILLSDLQMPSKDGLDLLRMIRAEHALSQLPVVLLTSGNLPEHAQNQVGKPGFFDSILDKPVRPEALMRAIASALNIWESYDVQEIQRVEEMKTVASMNRLRVLLAEDVEMNQMVATRMLKELGHEVTVVGDGKEALEAVTTEHYDLVFMDIQMPVMDGVQATLAIREMEHQGILKDKTTIVAMTANALKGDKAKYLSVGMDGYLSKPILLEELRNIINEVTGVVREEQSEEATERKPRFEASWCTIQGAALDGPRRIHVGPGKTQEKGDKNSEDGAALAGDQAPAAEPGAAIQFTTSARTDTDDPSGPAGQSGTPGPPVPPVPSGQPGAPEADGAGSDAGSGSAAGAGDMPEPGDDGGGQDAVAASSDSASAPVSFSGSGLAAGPGGGKRVQGVRLRSGARSGPDGPDGPYGVGGPDDAGDAGGVGGEKLSAGGGAAGAGASGGAGQGPLSGVESTPGIIDWDLLDRSFAGSKDFIMDSMHLYMRDAPRLLQEVYGAIERGDNGQLTVNAHALKGITGYFSRADVYERCLALEEAGRRAALPKGRVEMEQDYGALRALVDKLIMEMATFIKNEKGGSGA
ncbi:response regulator [Desulfovibrio sp. OttesenSCG-928-A18]|nr:response regulator [Desulfovibrio sp. OttesenSCG-928-A18]